MMDRYILTNFQIVVKPKLVLMYVKNVAQPFIYCVYVN